MNWRRVEETGMERKRGRERGMERKGEKEGEITNVTTKGRTPTHTVLT